MGPTRTPASTRRSHLTDSARTVRRPPNPWILYRCDKAKALKQEKPGMPILRQADLSKVISAMWRAETPEVRAHYERLADIKKAEHLVAHPDYRFQPMKKGEKERLKAEKLAEKERERSIRNPKAKASTGAFQDLPPLFTTKARLGFTSSSPPSSAASRPPVGKSSSQRPPPVVPQPSLPIHLPTPPTDHSSMAMPPTFTFSPYPSLLSMTSIPPLAAPQVSVLQHASSRLVSPQQQQHFQAPQNESGFNSLWPGHGPLPDMSQFTGPQVRLFCPCVREFYLCDA